MLATTMRLLRIEGTVNIEDSKGVTKPVIDNLRFQSGDALITGSDGLASVGLDDAKIVTLQNDSRAEFRKKNKQLELKLTKGAVFFNVTEKLKPDEKFEIKTSTMTAGIRGTSGIVYYDSKDENRETVAITDGSVIVSATNPKNNKTKSVEVVAGKTVKVYFYDDDGIHDSIEFELNDFDPNNLLEFTLTWLADNEDLLKKISEHTGWDPEKLKKIFKGIASGEITPPKEPEPEEPTTPPENTPTPDPEPSDSEPETTQPTTNKKKKKKKTATATQKPTPTPKPKVPSGYVKYVWGKKYSGHKVYIVTIDNERFKCWIKYKWVSVEPYVNEETGKRYFKHGGKTYYAEIWG
jgi:hypothetical protein